MTQRSDWPELRQRRMTEPGAQEAYDAAKVVFELGRQVREMREQRGWSQSTLAKAAAMTQPAVARFEAGGPFRRCQSWNDSPAPLEPNLSFS
jgi:ribosome-binding protein aMBF1 (putative translation factor)